MTYTRDATVRIVARDITGTNAAPLRYSYTGDGDTADATLDPTNNVIERTITLPGGVILTKRLGIADVWSYPNVHGDVASTASSVGVKLPPATFTYDPYGQGLNVLPDNSLGDFDYGWLGQHQRRLEHQPGLQPIIEMGARQYDPTIGRFLQVDPVEGGSANDYDYVECDPINSMDIAGTKACGKSTEAKSNRYHRMYIRRRSSTNEQWKQRAIGYRLHFAQKNTYRGISKKTSGVALFTLPNGKTVTKNLENRKATWYWHGNIDVKPGTTITFVAQTEYVKDAAEVKGSAGILICTAE